MRHKHRLANMSYCPFWIIWSHHNSTTSIFTHVNEIFLITIHVISWINDPIMFVIDQFLTHSCKCNLPFFVRVTGDKLLLLINFFNYIRDLEIPNFFFIFFFEYKFLHYLHISCTNSLSHNVLSFHNCCTYSFAGCWSLSPYCFVVYFFDVGYLGLPLAVIFSPLLFFDGLVFCLRAPYFSSFIVRLYNGFLLIFFFCQHIFQLR